jgi:hypothetical protein
MYTKLTYTYIITCLNIYLMHEKKFLGKHRRLALLRPVHGYLVKHTKGMMEATPNEITQERCVCYSYFSCF